VGPVTLRQTHPRIEGKRPAPCFQNGVSMPLEPFQSAYSGSAANAFSEARETRQVEDWKRLKAGAGNAMGNVRKTFRQTRLCMGTKRPEAGVENAMGNARRTFRQTRLRMGTKRPKAGVGNAMGNVRKTFRQMRPHMQSKRPAPCFQNGVLTSLEQIQSAYQGSVPNVSLRAHRAHGICAAAPRRNRPKHRLGEMSLMQIGSCNLLWFCYAFIPHRLYFEAAPCTS
jgi:hypothetical protein